MWEFQHVYNSNWHREVVPPPKARASGFIAKTSGGNDLFAHFSGNQGHGFKTLAETSALNFEITQGQGLVSFRTSVRSDLFDAIWFLIEPLETAALAAVLFWKKDST